jgi:hypothetical protein
MRRAYGWALPATITLVGGCLQVIGYEEARPGWTGGGGEAGSSSSTSSTSSSSASSSSGAGGSCTDGVKDGDETGKDCGGTCPMACPDGDGCKSGSDCTSKSCSPGGTCLVATCTDDIENEDETDVDCGGMTCGPCNFGKGCKLDGDCVTGFCNGKTCDAKTIVGGLTNPNSVVADPLNVYWADGDLGTVMVAPIATGTPSTVSSGLMSPERLVGVAGDPSALNPTQLFWVEPAAGNMDSDEFGAMPGTESPINSGLPQAVVAGGEYWTSQGPADMPLGSILTLELGDPGKADTLVSIEGQPDLIAYASAQALVFTLVDGSLWTTPTYFNGTPTMVFPSTSTAGLTADATYAYWTDGLKPGTVAKVPIAGGQPTVLASGQATPTDIAVDTFNVYWINQGSGAGTGAVMTAPLAGGAAVVLASGQDAPRGLFLSPNDVFWISGAKGQGAVKTLPK